jgi:tRNA pseudouridine55 synthase
VKKIWHAWTLDPFAHGLMIVAVGRDYTRLIDQYMGMDKTYAAVIKLWETSETMDSEWPIHHYSDDIPLQAQIEQLIASQVQTYHQMPPNFSAKKINGVPAYKLARAGKEVELKTKEVTIYKAEIINYSYPYVTVQYRVSSGTYIRVLAHELGQYLGTGAYCEQLCRDSIGEWDLSQWVNLDDVAQDQMSIVHPPISNSGVVHPPYQGGIEGGSLGDGFITNGFHLPYNPDNAAKAKVLRAEMTKAEKALWYNCLRELQISQIPSLSSHLESPPTSPCEGEQSQFGIPSLSPLAKGSVNCTDEISHKLKVLRQQPIDNYIVDFYIASVKLVIEIDGDSHYTDEAIAYDHKRTRDLEQYGLHVMRFTNTDVYTNFEWVYDQIIQYCQIHHEPKEIETSNIDELLLKAKII